MALMNELDGLFEADRDKNADRDCTDVNEEVLPGVIGLLWRVNVDHGWGFRSAASSVAMPPELAEMSMETMMKISIAI